MELKKRLRKISFLRDKVDGILLFSKDPNFFYFTNTYAEETFYYDFSRPVVIASQMGADQAREGWVRVKPTNIKKRADFFKALTETIGKKKIIGVNKKGLTATSFESLKRRFRVRDISKELEDVRMFKTNYEINYIRKACSISKDIFSAVKPKIRPGITENEVAGLFGLAAAKRNVPIVSIVAFGRNTRIPHHVPTGKRLRKGEAVLIDFGVCYNGYYSDITRMLNSGLENRLRNVIMELEPKIIPGVRASSLESFVRKRLGEYNKYFTHSLGHGLGIAVHEKPVIAVNSKDVLKPGMVFTIEPGVYLKNEGARIEDVYLMTGNGKKKLS